MPDFIFPVFKKAVTTASYNLTIVMKDVTETKTYLTKEKLEIAFTFKISPLKYDIYLFMSDESKRYK